jgi:hypothetical protein
MTFRIEKSPYNDSFSIYLGDRKRYEARTIQEVIYAIEHYFGVGVPGYNKPFDRTKHLNHAAECDCCPLCRKAKKARRSGG